MKVLLVGNLIEDRQESMQRFAALLADGLSARGHTVELLRPRLRAGRLARPYQYSGYAKYLGYIDKLVLFPRELRGVVRRWRPEVVHILDHSNAGYGRAAAAAPVVATVHDLLQVRAARGEFPQQNVGRMGRRQQAGILAAIARIPWLACVSNATRRDVLRLTAQPESHVKLVPNALNFPYAPVPSATARERLASLPLGGVIGTPGGYILQVGGAQWYKNRSGALEIYARLRSLVDPAPALVMVGPPLDARDAARATELGIAAHVTVLSALNNPQLAALYSSAEGLLFPSWIEGFGWPVAEAQACGCPVFLSQGEPMSEVGGPDAIYFNPADPASAATIIAAAWSTRRDLGRRGLATAGRWAPERMLAEYETLYSEAAA